MRLKNPAVVAAAMIGVVCLVAVWGCTDLGNEPPAAPAGIPAAPVALPATAVTATGFTANWHQAANATEYRLDVASDSLFVNPLAGLQDKNVGTTTTFGVTGLTTAKRYYYRVRAVGAGGTSGNSNTVGVTVEASSLTSFAGRVLPILVSYGCTGCHGGNGGLFVGSPADLLAGGDHGPAVTAFDAANSLMIKKLSSPPPFGSRMPLGSAALPADTIAVIRSWIDQGARNN